VSALRRTEARIAYDAPQFFFGGAIVTPAAAGPLLFHITDPTSLPPKRSPFWQTFSPCVTQTGLNVSEKI